MKITNITLDPRWVHWVNSGIRKINAMKSGEPARPSKGPRATGDKWELLKIVSARTRGGVYLAYRWIPNGLGTFYASSTGPVTESDIGTRGEEVHFINLAELGYDTHDLTDENAYTTMAWGKRSALSAVEQIPVYIGTIHNQKECEE